MNYQRFCPICDGSFTRGEAVIRCDGCGVLHHPACWNRNDGCQTTAPHDSRPVAIAYGLTAVTEPEATIGALRPIEPASRPAPEHSAPPRPRHNPPYPTGFSPSPPREPRRPKDRELAPLQKPMPSLYHGPGRWLKYWYVPAAAVLAAGIAFGIVTLVDWIVGDPEPTVAPAPSTTVISQTPLPTSAGTQAAGTAGTPDNAATPPANGGSGGFVAGGEVTVTGTGDCLNLRAGPSIDDAIITCLPDGTVLTVIEGPETSAGRTWWRVGAAGEDGWAAQEYLVAR